LAQKFDLFNEDQYYCENIQETDPKLLNDSVKMIKIMYSLSYI